MVKEAPGTYVSNTSVTTVLPAGVGAGLGVQVSYADGQKSQNTVKFEYDSAPCDHRLAPFTNRLFFLAAMTSPRSRH